MYLQQLKTWKQDEVTKLNIQDAKELLPIIIIGVFLLIGLIWYQDLVFTILEEKTRTSTRTSQPA
jgi:hypothetical protein